MVFVVAPWNYPWLTSVNAVIPALLAGNSVILKMAAQTPLVAERYAEAFKAAGLPEGVFQFLHLNHEQVARVIGDARVDFVAFTGSVAGGHAVQRAAAERFIATGLELGGKDPAYVRADADLECAVENLVDGAYFNSGQSCCGIERIYVHETLFERFRRRLRRARRGNTGSAIRSSRRPTLGPMVRTDAADNVRAQIGEADAQRREGAARAEGFQPTARRTFAPRFWSNVDHGMRRDDRGNLRPGGRHQPVKDDDGSDPR